MPNAEYSPKLGDNVLYARMHNGGKLISCLAIITGVEDKSTVHLLLFPPGKNPVPEAWAKRATEARQPDRWLPC